MPSDDLRKSPRRLHSMTTHANLPVTTPRDSIATRLLRHRQPLASRIRRQLAATGAPACALDDVLSTTFRRTDVLAAAGRIAADVSDRQLLALAGAISMRAAHELSRRQRADRRRAAAAAEVLRAAPGPTDPAGPDRDFRRDLEAVLGQLSEQDLAILGLRIRGADWPLVARELRTTPAAAHRRYYRALRALAGSFAA